MNKANTMKTLKELANDVYIADSIYLAACDRAETAATDDEANIAMAEAGRARMDWLKVKAIYDTALWAKQVAWLEDDLAAENAMHKRNEEANS